MITAPNKYLGITANKLSCIATELEQKNTTLTAENVRLQKEFEAEHALAEALGHELEQVKFENNGLRKLTQAVRDFLGDINCDGCPCRRDCDDNNRIFCGDDISYHAFQAMRELMEEVSK